MHIHARISICTYAHTHTHILCVCVHMLYGQPLVVKSDLFQTVGAVWCTA